MKAKFKVGDVFRLKEDHTFKQTWSIGEGEKKHMSAGSAATVSVVYEVTKGQSEPAYQLDFTDFKIGSLREAKLLELFDPI
jgi:hypothetical protein